MNQKFLTIALFALFVCFSSILSAQEYVVDAKSSSINWLGKKVTGEHSGTIAIKNGNLTKVRKSFRGEIAVNMRGIECTDLQGEYGDKLVGHLNSGDFFDVEKHPVATFRMTRTEQKENRELGTNYIVHGILTIKGISKPVNFPANILIEREMLTASGKLMVNRTDFDIKYGSGSFFSDLGDKMIYDDFELEINLVAIEATTREYSKRTKKLRNSTKNK